ncbi:MAG: AMP-binding protein [Desulfomicrobium escambiense]|nr:AMP-binding protein [Desulfomicrobium escambiense]
MSVLFIGLFWTVSAVRIFAALSPAAIPSVPMLFCFFRAIGLNLKQCYGLTESGGIFQIQPDDEVKLETVGKPLPQTEVKIADDQEVLVKSAANFSGYYNDYQSTQSAFDRRLAENRRCRIY